MQRARKIAEEEGLLLLSCILKLILRQYFLGEFASVGGGGTWSLSQLCFRLTVASQKSLTDCCLLAVCCAHLKGNQGFIAA